MSCLSPFLYFKWKSTCFFQTNESFYCKDKKSVKNEGNKSSTGDLFIYWL